MFCFWWFLLFSFSFLLEKKKVLGLGEQFIFYSIFTIYFVTRFWFTILIATLERCGSICRPYDVFQSNYSNKSGLVYQTNFYRLRSVTGSYNRNVRAAVRFNGYAYAKDRMFYPTTDLLLQWKQRFYAWMELVEMYTGNNFWKLFFIHFYF